jgi:predicted ATPase/DNA-binding winged helix-turn-helix (wHTH) protein
MAEQQSVVVERSLAFDRFLVLPQRRRLLEAGKPVRIGSRALDILLALLERPRERIGKAELLARVWPGVHVVEGNLKFQVATLRRVLRDGHDGRRFIETSPGLGYCFVAPVAVASTTREAGQDSPVSTHLHNLPEQLTTLVGRDEVLLKLVGQLALHRLVTIVGPGGIGKTSLALAVAERVIDDHPDGVWIVDFARLADPALVCGAVATAIGLAAGPGLGLRELVAALRGRRMLLVLDNCLHVVDAVASVAVAILRGAAGVRLLATSREPLRTEGEQIFRLGPLEVPPPAVSITAAEALRHAAVRLFVEQAAASLDGFELTDQQAPTVAEICRRLDGIPLAIELAAARVAVLGVDGVRAQLDDRLRLLTGGRRTSLPRHRTMRAALDWSYDLLDPAEQRVFHGLAIFVGGFTLAAAAAVLADERVSPEEVERLVLELATKSLVAPDPDTRGPRFRLLETSRAAASSWRRLRADTPPGSCASWRPLRVTRRWRGASPISNPTCPICMPRSPGPSRRRGILEWQSGWPPWRCRSGSRHR